MPALQASSRRGGSVAYAALPFGVVLALAFLLSVVSPSQAQAPNCEDVGQGSRVLAAGTRGSLGASTSRTVPDPVYTGVAGEYLRVRS